MALAAFAENKQMTLPVTPEGDAAFKKFMKTAMTSVSAKNDPVQAENDISPDIKHGKDVLVLRTNKIVDKYDPNLYDEEKRLENGGLAPIDVILARNSYMLESAALTQAAITYSLSPPPGHSEGRSYVGRDGKRYTEVLDEKGNHVYSDNGTMCLMNKGGLSSTMEVRPNDDLIDKQQAMNITFKLGSDGKLVERTAAEADFQLAMARIDNQYTKLPMQLNMVDRIIDDVAFQAGRDASIAASKDPQFTTATGAPIKSHLAPTENFGAAASEVATPQTPVQSVVFRKDRPDLPSWVKPPEPMNVIERPELGLRM